MLKFHGGETVGKGTYWNLTNGERVDIENEGILPGTGKKAFYRMPAAAIIVAAPVVGLAYAAFLPFIGIAMLLKLVAQKIGGGAREMVIGGGHFGFRPSESYLAGKKRKADKVKDENEDEPLAKNFQLLAISCQLKAKGLRPKAIKNTGSGKPGLFFGLEASQQSRTCIFLFCVQQLGLQYDRLRLCTQPANLLL